MKSTAILSVLLLLTACGTMPPPATDSDKIHEYSQPYEILFEAAKAVLVEFGCDIQTSNREGGVLHGQKLGISEFASTLLVGQGIYVVYDVTFLLGEETTRVRVQMYSVLKDGTHRSEATKPGYDDFWKKFEKLL